jgi:hypothetical protein
MPLAPALVESKSAINMIVSHHSKKLALLALSLVARIVTANQDPKNNFCRRYGHQSTVVDDKLYIDGGWVNYDTFKLDHKSYPSTLISTSTTLYLHPVERLATKWPILKKKCDGPGSVLTFRPYFYSTLRIQLA